MVQVQQGSLLTGMQRWLGKHSLQEALRCLTAEHALGERAGAAFPSLLQLLQLSEVMGSLLCKAAGLRQKHFKGLFPEG